MRTLGAAQAGHRTGSDKLAAHEHAKERLERGQLASHGGGIVLSVQAGKVRTARDRVELPDRERRRVFAIAPFFVHMREDLAQIRQVRAHGVRRDAPLALEMLAKKVEERLHRIRS